ncbi:MAG: hypothetical protein HQL21_05190 [Candidatus Omnitrophica bacterium]|nr:hypothetical protein [Candidatus Omnitrophota bacterium]
MTLFSEESAVKTVFYSILFCLLFCGCSVYRIDSVDTTLDFYPPKDSDEKVVYLEKIEKPFDIIGVVMVTTERTHSFDEILVKMKHEAAVLGGDAITDLKTDAAGAWGSLTPAKLFKNAYIHARYSAKVVVLK